jgi:hypothetical protein
MPMTSLLCLYASTVVEPNGNILQPWLHAGLATIEAVQHAQQTGHNFIDAASQMTDILVSKARRYHRQRSLCRCVDQLPHAYATRNNGTVTAVVSWELYV